MDRCVEVAIDFARAQVEAGVDTVGIGDAIASQIDPGTYEALIQPREKRLVEAIQGMGAFVKLHICGNMTHLLPGIADLGVDVLDIDHMVDLAVARAAVGEPVVLDGQPRSGVGRALRHPRRDPRRRARRATRRPGNPYMVNAGCEIPAGTPPENLPRSASPFPIRAECRAGERGCGRSGW